MGGLYIENSFVREEVYEFLASSVWRERPYISQGLVEEAPRFSREELEREDCFVGTNGKATGRERKKDRSFVRKLNVGTIKRLVRF